MIAVADVLDVVKDYDHDGGCGATYCCSRVFLRCHGCCSPDGCEIAGRSTMTRMNKKLILLERSAIRGALIIRIRLWGPLYYNSNHSSGSY